MLLPEYFTNEQILPVLQKPPPADPAASAKYPLTCGLCMKLKSAVTRVVKHTKMTAPCGEGDTYGSRLDRLMRHYAHDDVLLQAGYSADDIWDIGSVISRKYHTLSVKLQKELCLQPLAITQQRDVFFNQDFTRQVQEYFSTVRRPEGTFELHSSRHKDRIERIAKLPRELCSRCKGRKCVYCGECGGLRMPGAMDLLPDRIELPFDVLLLVHWNESLHKCTGIHSAVLSTEGSVEVKKRIVAGLDSESDFVLFPSEDAVVAEDVEWRVGDGGGLGLGLVKKRLVVLEATWQHGKSMAKELSRLRGELNLPPLRFVSLRDDIVGQYWRFHNEGHSAVSTIEAICHAALAAGLSDRNAEDFLFLFNLQKYRLLERIKTDGKTPRAMDVTKTYW